MRKLLPPIYPDLLFSDFRPPADLGPSEKFKAADLSDLAQVEAICEGVDGIIHFGGYSVEGAWDNILQANIIGGYNLFEAARKRASSASCLLPRTMPSASIRAITGSAPT